MKIKSKVWLEKNGKLVFGEGKSNLLKAIDKTGSINKASKQMGISFRRGWAYITAIEKRLGIQLIARSKGGKHGGGSCLTPAGKMLVRKFDKLEDIVRKFTDAKFQELFAPTPESPSIYGRDEGLSVSEFSDGVRHYVSSSSESSDRPPKAPTYSRSPDKIVGKRRNHTEKTLHDLSRRVFINGNRYTKNK
ncbi:MAG: LysR family transcriptional regulator [Candidatus Omnitrophica bacterium]|nr:LysR family transcriptional regulator [Candidatus Omnitrophota bacterium]